MSKETERIRASLLAKPGKAKIPREDFLSSGSTLLNLAATDRYYGAFAKGHYYWLVGDSESGKTFAALTCFAEACLNSNFDDYRLIFDNGEDGALMDFEKFFGKKVADRVEPPSSHKGEPVYSRTIEQLYFHLDDAVKDGRPFIYVQDSIDFLSSRSEGAKFQETKTASRKDKKVAGSYGDNKAKINSSGIRQILPGLKETKSILILISQTRDDFSFGAMPGGKTHAGGHALKFYATLQIWTSIRQQLTKDVKGKKRQLGTLVKVAVRKNRMTGRKSSVFIPFFHSVGMDDTGSCVDFLIEEKHWSKSKGVINAKEFNVAMSRDDLIAQIEDGDMEKDLRKLVGKVWKDIALACQVKRKKRYQ